ncbi:serine hydrolase domain-containing protein [Chryseobacterium sp. ISL-6]|uniref:serine hydrolase domain-containing protein n=1 Tax=Chryseobacterium sp. ISL-6 TaxID=2819143 RepID=UPI001BEA3976|nr:serine hydrolase domain-containing protein [Chryseobacterium sp. ISL-6]MBT2619850.1 serine hydrolase [Chryseobacterium sp. ISL-6]
MFKKYLKIKILMILIFFNISFALAQENSNAVKNIEKQLAVLEKENNLSGVVLIAKNGKPIFKQAYGMANIADHIPNKINTKFNLASMNKMFTAMAVMQLVQEGKISVQDYVGKYLTDYPNKTVHDSVTIHQLLTHTSGLESFWDEHAKLAKEKFRNTSDYRPLFVDKKPIFKPGTQMLYSNTGYMILGLIIEKLTGKNYSDYVKEKIFVPLKMYDTDAYELDDAILNMATGYTMSVEKPGQWKNNTFLNVIKGTPAGGGFSTAEDLLKFADALQNNVLLNKKNTEIYTKGSLKYRDARYAYGIIESDINGHRIIGHTGGHYGIANELMIFTDMGYTVVILTNGEVENYWEAGNFIKQQLAGTTPALDNFFYTRKVIRQISDHGYESGKKMISDDSGKHVLKENLIERYGYKSLFERKNQLAIDLFITNISQFPDSSYGYYNLSEAYRISGQKKEAIAYLKCYLEKEPTDQDARIKYEKLAH